MKLNRAGIAAGLLAATVALAACGSDSSDPDSTSPNAGGPATTSSDGSGGGKPTCSSGTLNAEGSTAQTNAINQWIKDYQAACSGATINYNPTGSGDGVSKFIQDQVDFAGSDSALKADEGEVSDAQKRCGSKPLDLPMVVGPIAAAYNLKSVSDPITLTGEVLAKIFKGDIKTWDDAAIKKLNSGVSLPSTKITVFYRSDSSGTTENFQKFLKATAPSVFTGDPDKDSSKAGWTGQGKAKSQGVADAVSQTDGAIGYMEYSFAVSSQLKSAQIDNGGGAVALTPANASKAAETAEVTGSGDDLSLKIDYANKTAGAYPLILVTYEIVCSKYKDAAKGTFVKNFLTYTSGAGQSSLLQLGYAPLPDSLKSKVQASIAKIS
ncbi:type 2 periplasmic-binding domain-containing protein [Jatrophihabitans fulvus]